MGTIASPWRYDAATRAPVGHAATAFDFARPSRRSRDIATPSAPFDNHGTDPSQGDEMRQEWTHASPRGTAPPIRTFRGGLRRVNINVGSPPSRFRRCNNQADVILSYPS